ncbi:glutamate--cysteine ligase regulatory subunit [Ischnura elegans]|uniref:glutamate--cysteine ligase regulatory subunit n=1 Tax=Ischnura elegans TaxID=197161 RepID=UPI001ED88CB4|nr:glutamate--cysteine ligase regulatory subunit [Ischnura elegans]
MAEGEEMPCDLVIHTGNILNMNEVKMKAGQNTTQELLESLKYVINGFTDSSVELDNGELVINKVGDYKSLKLDSHEDRRDVKVSVKIFIRQYNGETIRRALDQGFQALNTPIIESVVLALPADNPIPVPDLHEVWKVMEEFVNEKKVISIGVSDIETDAFIELYNWTKVKPGIVQINLAHCCVVPPPLQAFTREHSIQLLTHSDPTDILPDDLLEETTKELDRPLTKYMAKRSLLWATRYHIHIKCRGVLTSKGYILCLKK